MEGIRQSSEPERERFLYWIGIIATIINFVAVSLIMLPGAFSSFRYHVRPLQGKELRLSQAGSASELVLSMDRDCAVSCNQVAAFIVGKNQNVEDFNPATLIMHDVKGLTWEIVGKREVALYFCYAIIDHYQYKSYYNYDETESWIIYFHKKCNK